jgi:hypothetical protein
MDRVLHEFAVEQRILLLNPSRLCSRSPLCFSDLGMSFRRVDQMALRIALMDRSNSLSLGYLPIGRLVIWNLRFLPVLRISILFERVQGEL